MIVTTTGTYVLTLSSGKEKHLFFSVLAWLVPLGAITDIYNENCDCEYTHLWEENKVW